MVYRAFDRVRGTEVALKTLRRAEYETMYRLKKEFRARYGKELQDAVRDGTKGAWGEFCEELCVKRMGDEVRRVERVEVDTYRRG